METGFDTLLLKFPGTNCDAETERALRVAGFRPRVLPFSEVSSATLDQSRLIVLPGGFSYGDYIMAGRLAQLRIQSALGDALYRFHQRGGHLLGICNGFQILCKLGLLPAGSLVAHADGRFLCRWVKLSNRRPDHPYLSALPTEIEFPIACAEGRFVTAEEGQAADYVERGLAALTYIDNVNDSMAGVAGLTDETGRVFGLMPHPERFLSRRHHYDPDWRADDEAEHGWGYHFFRSMHRAIYAGEAAS